MQDTKELSRQDLRRVKKAFFKPWNTLPFFTGLVLILLFAMLAYHANQEQEQIELALFSQPQINDVYLTDLSQIFSDADLGDYKFGTLRIDALEESGILFSVGTGTYTTSYGLGKRLSKSLPGAESYHQEEKILIPYDKVNALHESDAIKRIYRTETRTP